MADSATSFESQPFPGQSEVIERLQDAARVSASWDVAHRPSSPGNLRVHARKAPSVEIRLQRLLEQL